MRVIPLYEPNLLVHQRTNGMVSVKKNHTIQEKKRFQDLVTRDFQSDVDIFQNFHFTLDVDDIKRMKSQWVSGTMIYMYLHFLKEETNRQRHQVHVMAPSFVTTLTKRSGSHRSTRSMSCNYRRVREWLDACHVLDRDKVRKLHCKVHYKLHQFTVNFTV